MLALSLSLSRLLSLSGRVGERDPGWHLPIVVKTVSEYKNALAKFHSCGGPPTPTPCPPPPARRWWWKLPCSSTASVAGLLPPPAAEDEDEDEDDEGPAGPGAVWPPTTSSCDNCSITSSFSLLINWSWNLAISSAANLYVCMCVSVCGIRTLVEYVRMLELCAYFVQFSL